MRARERETNDRGMRKIGWQGWGIRGRRDSLPEPILIVPGNEGVIK